MTNTLIRHSLADRLMHWFNCACWLFLFFTGIALLMEPAPFGQSYSNVVRNIVGGGEALLQLHIFVGITWCCGTLLYVLLDFKASISFFKEIFCLEKNDFKWIVRKPFVMVLGKARTEKLGLPSELPEQGFYNFGQKAFGSLALIGSVLLAITGLYMALAYYFNAFNFSQSTLQLFILIHFLAAIIVFLGLLVHIYMAAISPDEKPGFVSMFSGTVPESYAKHHHGIWFKRYK